MFYVLGGSEVGREEDEERSHALKRAESINGDNYQAQDRRGKRKEESESEVTLKDDLSQMRFDNE